MIVPAFQPDRRRLRRTSLTYLSNKKLVDPLLDRSPRNIRDQWTLLTLASKDIGAALIGYLLRQLRRKCREVFIEMFSELDALPGSDAVELLRILLTGEVVPPGVVVVLGAPCDQPVKLVEKPFM